jgi:putative alpha-1,2-mannosidase
VSTETPEFRESPLPDNCPPDDAVEIRRNMFRITTEDVVTEADLVPYARMYRQDRFNQCIAYALSFYDSLEGAIKALESAKARGRHLGNYVIETTIRPEHGCAVAGNSNGHHSIWLYKGVSPADFPVHGVHYNGSG